MQENDQSIPFIIDVLVKGEAIFMGNGITDLHNTHVWAALEDPHARVPDHLLLNVSAGFANEQQTKAFIL